MVRQNQGPPQRGPGLGTLAITLLFALSSLALFLTDRTGWLLLAGMGLIWGLMRLLPARLDDQKGLIALFLGLLLSGYWASYHLLTQERVLFLVNTLPSSISPTDDPGTVRLSALMLGASAATVVWALLLIIAGWFSVRWILALHERAGVTVFQAWVLLISLVTGIHQRYCLITNGGVSSRKPGGILSIIGGPGWLEIPPGYAAICERAGKVSRIAMPGVVLLKRFERVARVLELRPLWKTQLAKNVLTYDRVPLTIRFGVGFQLGRNNPANRPLEQRKNVVYPVNEEDLLQAAYHTAGPWRALPPTVAEIILRQIVATYTFDELMNWNRTNLPDSSELRLDATPIKLIETQIRRQLEEILHGWGMRITGFTIVGVEVPEEIREEVVTRHWRDEVMVAEAEARARVLEKISAAKLDSWGAMLQRVLKALEKAATEQDSRVAIEYITLLERIEVLEEMARQGRLRMPHNSEATACAQE